MILLKLIAMFDLIDNFSVIIVMNTKLNRHFEKIILRLCIYIYRSIFKSLIWNLCKMIALSRLILDGVETTTTTTMHTYFKRLRIYIYKSFRIET